MSLKRLLLLLDDTPSAHVALAEALRLAKTHDASLAGLAGVDLGHISVSMPGGIGTSSYASRIEAAHKQQAEEKRQHLREVLARECEAHNVRLDWLSFEGEPLEALYQAAETRDLLISGHDLCFYDGAHEPLSESLGAFLKNAPRPVIVCPDQKASDGPVLVAYDGSPPSMRAVQLFALLDLARSRPIHVVAIDEDEETAFRRAYHAADFLRGNGSEVVAKPITTGGGAASIIRSQVEEAGSELLVMGAYGHRGLKDMLFGSTTTHLIEAPPCPLFIYH